VALAEWSEQTEDIRLAFVVGCIGLAVALTRFLLKLLMLLGHGVSCFLLRQMEYDADSYEIQIAGSAGYESAARRLAELGAGLAAAYKEMRTTWNLSRRLPDDFPAYLVFQTSKLAPAKRERIQDTLGLKRTGLFDTHPSDGDRIRCARRAGEPGVFDLELPASVLFSNFGVIAKQVTHLHYADDLRIRVDGGNLRPVGM
jgi:Zn-dependent protease with chaperone function